MKGGISTRTNELLHTAVEMGDALLESGAETYRVEETVSRFVHAYGMGEADVFAVPTCIIVSITREDGGVVTKTRRIHTRGANLDRVDRLNALSRRACAGELPLEEAEEALREAVSRSEPFPPWVRTLGAALIAGAFTPFFGGGPADAACAFFLGAVVQTMVFGLGRRRANAILTCILASGATALLAVAAVRLGLGRNVDKIIIGVLMNLVPGVALTNAMRDIMAGDYVAGQARLTEALLTAAAMALGAGAALFAARLI